MMKLVVLSCVLAAASATGLFAGYAAPYTPFAYAAPYAPLAYAASYYQPHNYRGPLSLAPGQPANILGADGRPLDTLDVNLDRAAHYTAKAFDGIHSLKKRSIVAAPFIAPYAPLAYTAPLAYAAPLVQPANYRGPLSLAPGQPANILGADGRPLDTLDVNLDRAAHYTAKAFEGAHILKKRSAAIIAPVAPVAHVAAIAPVAPIAPVAVARTPLITSSYAYTAPAIARISPISYAAPYTHYF